MRSTDMTLHSRTPVVGVTDSRGLTVRTLTYHRHPDTPETLDERLTHSTFSATGQPLTSADPRLGAAGRVNFTVLSTLTGQPLLATGADNGTALTLHDIAGRPHLQVTGDNVIRTFSYEDVTLPGRLLCVTEQARDGAACITERFVYAGNTDAEKDLNLAGVAVSHYDTAGREQTDSIALTGTPLSVTRRLLKNADKPDTLADWQGKDSTAWDTLLETTEYTSQTTTDATGATLSTTDAEGNLQRVTYDVAGLLSGSWLTLKGDKEQVIVKSLTYSAAGQKLREEHGNGVVTTYDYEPETLRLTGIKTERPAGHPSGAKVLQDLRYEYDPVGNVLQVTNDAEETRFWRNQKVVPENTYVYDTLYQLVSATGREMANIVQQGSGLPSATVPLPTDSAAYTNYTRAYTYDEAGNLTQIRHNAGATRNTWTTDITVSDRSNRGLLSSLATVPSDVDSLFSTGGHQTQLLKGQALTWNVRGELQQVTTVTRDTAPDTEHYRYASGSQRLLKVSVQKTNGGTQTQQVIYLPGLELRSTTAGTTETENRQTLTVGEAGRAQVRVLHWESGQPTDTDNNQLRYSYDTLTSSSGLELDGDGNIISQEEYYPYGGTAVWTARSQQEADYKTMRYAGKERDATGLYYYGYRYYQPWAGRWLSADPAGTVDGLNLYRMVRNNPVTMDDPAGLNAVTSYLVKPATKIVKKMDKYLTVKTTNYLMKHHPTANVRRWNQVRRSVMLGIGVGMSIFSLLSGVGVALGVATGVAAAGFAIAATAGWFAHTLSDKFAGSIAKKMQGKSAGLQMIAGAGVAAVSAKLHNASTQGTIIASGAGTISGGVGAIVDNTEAGMAGANAAGSAVGTVDTLSGGQARLPVQVGAATGGGVGGLILGTTEGSAEVGESAGFGAYVWGQVGKSVDDWTSLSSWGITTAKYAVGGLKGEALEIGARKLISGSAGQFEWWGAVIGGIIAGAYHATDIRTDGELTNISNAVEVARSTVSGERLRQAFINYFVPDGNAGTSLA